MESSSTAAVTGFIERATSPGNWALIDIRVMVTLTTDHQHISDITNKFGFLNFCCRIHVDQYVSPIVHSKHVSLLHSGPLTLEQENVLALANAGHSLKAFLLMRFLRECSAKDITGTTCLNNLPSANKTTEIVTVRILPYHDVKTNGILSTFDVRFPICSGHRCCRW